MPYAYVKTFSKESLEATHDSLSMRLDDGGNSKKMCPRSHDVIFSASAEDENPEWWWNITTGEFHGQADATLWVNSMIRGTML
jgi:hypothetical protein